MAFTRKYLSSYRGMTEVAKGTAGLLIGNIIRRASYIEADRAGIQKFANQYDYSYQDASAIIEGALSSWIKEVNEFKRN